MGCVQGTIKQKHADHFSDEDINYWLKLLATSCVLHVVCMK